MKQLFTLLVAATIMASCNSVKNIYTSDNINDRQLEKLVKSYLKTPQDTAAANRVLFAYNSLLNEQLEKIESLKQNNSLQSMERLIGAYDELQTLYNTANQNNLVSRLVQPGNVSVQRQEAVNNAAAAWYDHANQLLASNNWQNGREALGVYRKINNWIPNYQDSRRLAEDARELGTIDAVIEPLRTEGFFYGSGYSQTGSLFTRQLLTDLGNRWNNGTELYRVYDSRDARYNNIAADWVIEPVITRMQIDPVSYNRSTRTVTKNIEVGKDSTKNPIYKTISAVLTITEANVCATTELEARISDIANNSRIGRRSFNENYTLREVSATYTGDKNALGSDDWKLVNNRNRLQIDERWLQEKLLEQIYPNLLDYLRGMMR
ncbi:hypothetical protein BH10BAC3_BH10BAC3_41240 [soil metagenome]